MLLVVLVIVFSCIIFLAFILGMYALHLRTRSVKLHHVNTRINRRIVQSCPGLSGQNVYNSHACSSVCFCSGPIQSVLVSASPFSKPTIREQYVRLSDGGQIRLDWFNEDRLRFLPLDSPVIVSFPQVGACSPYSHMNAMLCHRILSSDAARVVQTVYQGLGGLVLSSCHLPGTPYCGTDDVGDALKTVHAAYPNAPIIVTCLSIGSAHFTRWAGCNPCLCTEYNVIGAVALGHGFSAEEAGSAGARKLGGAPGKRIVKFWKENVFSKNNSNHLEALDGTNGFDLAQLEQAMTLKQWDTALLPLYGYSSMEAMLEKCDAVHVLQDLSIPMLFINAENDPVCPAARMRRAEHPQLLKHPQVILASTTFGGHLQWPEGCCQPHHHWILDVVAEYADAVREHCWTAISDDACAPIAGTGLVPDMNRQPDKIAAPRSYACFGSQSDWIDSNDFLDVQKCCHGLVKWWNL